MEKQRPCGDLICDGQNCALVSLLKNQANTNLTETFGDPRLRMTKATFEAFLNRVQASIPMCCQQTLAQAVLDEVKQQAEKFFSSQQKKHQ